MEDTFRIDSVGLISYHTGEPPDQRAVKVAGLRGYRMDGLRARQIHRGDLSSFDWLVPMDHGHLHELREMIPPARHDRIRLLLSFLENPASLDVPDPYYGGPEGFQHTLDLIEQCIISLLDQLRTTHGIR